MPGRVTILILFHGGLIVREDGGLGKVAIFRQTIYRFFGEFAFISNLRIARF